MSQYQQTWNEVTKFLKEAREFLDVDSSSVETIDDNEFVEYLENNELELALDEIEAIAEAVEVPKEFWQCLLKAANRMELKEHSKRYVEIVGYF